MLGDAKIAYDKLTTSILATARAQAAYGKIGEKAGQQIAIDETNKAIQTQIDETKKAIAFNEKQAKSMMASIKPSTENAVLLAQSADALQRSTLLHSKIKDLQYEQTKNLLTRAKLQEDINDLEGIAVTNQDKILDTTKKTGGAVKTIKSYLDDVQSVLQKSQFSVDIAESDGLDKLLERNTQKYKVYLDNLDKLEKANKGKNVTQPPCHSNKPYSVRS